MNQPTNKSVLLNIVRPYDFALCMRAFRSFGSASPDPDDRLRLATRIDGIPTLIEISQKRGPENKLIATFTSASSKNDVKSIAEWVLFAELDLSPFYHLTVNNPIVAPITQQLQGLKPMRPISLFEMAVVAITEQQISMAAAHKIRSRIVQRYGELVNNEWIFPEPVALSKATLEDLRYCGLSRQKADYIHNLAATIASGELDLDVLKTMDDDEARETIMNLRGFGRWSADYILVRGLARPDRVPIDDLGIRSVVGQYLGNGQRLSSSEVSEILEPFQPYRGLLAFYLLVANRLKLTPAG